MRIRLPAVVMASLTAVLPTLILPAPTAAVPATATAGEVTLPEPSAPFATWGDLVTQIHRDLLDRAPTPAEAATATAALADGTLTPGQLVARIRSGADHSGLVDPAVRLYGAALGRAPDPGGFGFWTTRRRTGTWSLVKMAGYFATSPEFQRRYGNLANRAYVERIYTNVLGRPSDPGGADFWTRQLDRGTRGRGHVLASISESKEHRTKTAASTTTDVLFLTLLRRPATAAERDRVTTALRAHLTTGALAANVLDDHEYHRRFRPGQPHHRLVTRSHDGSAADGWSSLGSMTGDGRLVVFMSTATNLVDEVAAGPTGDSRLYLWERFTGITRLEARPPGITGEVYLFGPTISDDGRFVSYLAWAPSSSVPEPQVHLLDRQTGAITRITASPSGGPADRSTWQAKISADGHHVVFTTETGEADGDTDVFSWERATGTTTQVSTTPEGGDPDGPSGDASPSGDGRFIAFGSGATDLDPGHVSRGWETFVWDRATGRSTQISIPAGPTPEPGPWYTTSPRISRDGGTVLYQSNATDLVPGSRSGLTDILLWDRATGATVQVNDDAGAGHAAWVGYWAALSGDGRHVAHQASGRSPDPGDYSHVAWTDLQVWHRQSGDRTIALAAPAMVAMPFALAEEMTMNHDGSALVLGTADRLTAADTNDEDDIYLLHA